MNVLPTKSKINQRGTALIEVLVSLLILLIGLLGLAGLQVQAQRSEMESYQRVQALVLLQDMAGRINANRRVASCYAVTTNMTTGAPFLGTGSTVVPACAIGAADQRAIAIKDLQDWNSTLLGAAETLAGSNTGAMIGARGCVSYGGTGTEVLDQNGIAIAGTGIYTIAVAWQGLGDTFAAPAPVNAAAMSCGKNQYGAETRRRVVSLTMRVGSLTTL